MDNIRTDLKEIDINTRNLVDLAQDRNYWRALCEFGIEPLGSISHGVTLYIYKLCFVLR